VRRTGILILLCVLNLPGGAPVSALILRSRPKVGVSKDGPNAEQAPSSFETRGYAALLRMRAQKTVERD